MYNLRYLVVREGWEPHDIEVDQDNIVLVYTYAIRLVKEAANIIALDFIPLGDGEYLIWGQGKCQGYMSIKEVGQRTSAPVVEGGQ
jgi:hypothetical protein